MSEIREIKNINDAKAFLKAKEPINYNDPNKQTFNFDPNELYLLFDFIFKKLESLEIEDKSINKWIDALASRTGRRFQDILKRLNELDKKGEIFPGE